MSRINTIYPKRYLCTGGEPHDIVPYKEYADVSYEQCKRCGKMFRWNKAEGGKIDNKEYLKVHQRDFAQRMGRTRKLYEYLYVNPYKKADRMGATAIAERKPKSDRRPFPKVNTI